MKELQLKDAKATLSAMVDRAVAGEPTVITRHGRKEAVLVRGFTVLTANERHFALLGVAIVNPLKQLPAD